MRPLQSSDLRYRRVSGRYQISADGRRLIDGVTFGDRYLQPMGRPPVDIPPRKRRRVSYDQDGDDLDHREVVGRPSLDNENITLEESDSRDDEDFWPEMDEDRSRIKALKEVCSDSYNPLVQSTETATLDRPEETAERVNSSRSIMGLGIQGGVSALELVGENVIVHAGKSNLPLDEFEKDQQPPQKQITTKYGKAVQRPSHRSHDNALLPICEDHTKLTREIHTKDISSAPPSNAKRTHQTTLLDVQDSDRSSDENIEPGNEESTDLSESDKENSQPKIETHEIRMVGYQLGLPRHLLT